MSPRLIRDVLTALRHDNEINLSRLVGMATRRNPVDHFLTLIDIVRSTAQGLLAQPVSTALM